MMSMTNIVIEWELDGSLINPFTQGLSKVNKYFDPHYTDKFIDTVTSCRAEHCTQAKRIKRKKCVNTVGEIMSLVSKVDSKEWDLVKLDPIRAAILSKAFMNGKHVKSIFFFFCTIGSSIILYVSTNQFEGFTMNLELGTVALPATYDDFPKVVNELDILCNITKDWKNRQDCIVAQKEHDL
ncbi:uncharacterized protein B0P05DRAFT_608209 [Gilbertella persicaria]|uniref:uncharacterized protein n=1 Tax=Gilbertella persicaria TaxID=101096 RepID=UPI00222053B3|nr:uncharacterized protein B0P05DRAFT_608209 [Gilbertella persicaria]KAI8086973.1 hypothetical protein B0P05DRAFT_608209 [Gilbertella persicaria]